MLNSKSKIIRVLLTNIGIMDSYKNSNELARNLSAAGMDVICIGNCYNSGEVIQAASQEDADLIGINLLSCPNKSIFSSIFDLLKKANDQNLTLFVCGILNNEDEKFLKNKGISEVLLLNKSPVKFISRLQEIVYRLSTG
jgi:methylmalonyl-CoA mutase C-terminal domain/subunit